MAKALYLVIHSRESWWVDFEGTAYGPYDTREQAALEARRLANVHTATGRDAEVLVPDGEGRFWVIWSSTKDRSGGPGSGFTPHRAN